jgi:hypothetical protein
VQKVNTHHVNLVLMFGYKMVAKHPGQPRTSAKRRQHQNTGGRLSLPDPL